MASSTGPILSLLSYRLARHPPRLQGGIMSEGDGMEEGKEEEEEGERLVEMFGEGLVWKFQRVLQCVAVCCSVWQGGAELCSVLQCVAVCCSLMQCVAGFGECCRVLPCVAVRLKARVVLQSVAVCCSTSQCLQP